MGLTFHNPAYIHVPEAEEAFKQLWNTHGKVLDSIYASASEPFCHLIRALSVLGGGRPLNSIAMHNAGGGWSPGSEVLEQDALLRAAELIEAELVMFRAMNINPDPKFDDVRAWNHARITALEALQRDLLPLLEHPEYVRAALHVDDEDMDKLPSGEAHETFQDFWAELGSVLQAASTRCSDEFRDLLYALEVLAKGHPINPVGISALLSYDQAGGDFQAKALAMQQALREAPTRIQNELALAANFLPEQAVNDDIAWLRRDTVESLRVWNDSRMGVLASVQDMLPSLLTPERMEAACFEGLIHTPYSDAERNRIHERALSFGGI